MRRQHNLKVGRRTAEAIKINVGAVISELDPDLTPAPAQVQGAHQVSSLPLDVHITHKEIAHCLDKSIQKVEDAIMNTLEKTPPELYTDIINNGINLTGGGALMRGLAKRLTDKVKIQFNVAEDPLHAVARGTGIALKNLNRFKFLYKN
jgi:rod shape-determining protein MreB